MRNAALKCVFIVNNVIQANKLLQVKKNPIDPLVLSVFNDLYFGDRTGPNFDDRPITHTVN